jgi:toxin ParE1/3/4
MSRILRSSRAEGDLYEIWDYIAHDNTAAASKLLRTIGAKFEMLLKNPLMGQDRSELAPQMRSFSVGHYVIYYRPFSNGIEIIRVLHGARDVDSIFFSRGKDD